MTKAKPKDSLAWLEELVEAAKAWRATFPIEEARAVDKHGYNGRALAVAVDGYRQAIKDEVEAEMNAEEHGTGNIIHRDGKTYRLEWQPEKGK